MIATVKYSIASYSGEVTVYGVEPDEETDTVIARAKKQLARQAGGSLPFGSQTWHEVSRVSGEDGS